MKFQFLSIYNTAKEFVARFWFAIYAVLSVMCLLVTFASGDIHDYKLYMLQWSNIVSGGNPWADTYMGEKLPTNAYGPVHALIAGFMWMHPLAPKVFLAMLTLLAPLLVFGAPIAADRKRDASLQFALIYSLSPLVLVTAFLFGINDAVVGFLIVAACLFRSRGGHSWAGVAIGVAALLKFYPLLFAPLFAVSRNGSAKLTTVLFAGGTFLVGMIAAWLIWQEAVFSPFVFGDERGAKHLSILRSLSEMTGFLPISSAVDFLLSTNTLCVIAVAVLVPIWGWTTRQGWEVTTLVGVLSIFLTYKVGHQQFYVSWIAVFAWILCVSKDSIAVRVARASIPIAVYLSAYQIVYLGSRILTGEYLGGDLAWIRAYGSIGLIATVVWSASRCYSSLKPTDGPPISIRI